MGADVALASPSAEEFQVKQTGYIVLLVPLIPQRCRPVWGRQLVWARVLYDAPPAVVFGPDTLTAAHRTLPFGTRVRVTNLEAGKTVVVRINDRGPFRRHRVIDLAHGAATVLQMKQAGEVPVAMEILGD